MYLFRVNTNVIKRLKNVTVGMMYGVNWCSVTFLSVDSAIALKTNLRYAELVTTKRTINTTILCIWTFYFTMIPDWLTCILLVD